MDIDPPSQTPGCPSGNGTHLPTHGYDRRLTGRELLALQLAARGYSVRQIASLHGVGDEEVQGELASALEVLGVPTIPQAIAEARRRGLIE